MIVEKVGDELLVYDSFDHKAYLVPAGKGFDVRRRGVLKGLVAAGVAIVTTAPTVAQAASECPAPCERGDFGKACGPDCKGRCFGKTCRL